MTSATRVERGGRRVVLSTYKKLSQKLVALHLSRQLSLTHSPLTLTQISISSSVAYTFGTTVGTKWPVRSTVAYVRLPALRMYPSVC